VAKNKGGDSSKKYFWKSKSIDSVPDAIAELEIALGLARATDLRLLDQQTMSQESFVSALWVWAGMVAREKGARGLEEVLRRPFEELSRIVAADLKKHPRA
jgi:hypothetical protein